MWIIITLVSLIILFILILCVPLDFVLDINTHRSPKYKFRLLWFFGLVDTELKRSKGEFKSKKKTVPEKPKKRRGIRAGTVYQIIRIRGLFTHIFKFLRDIIRSFRIKELKADINVGFDNPADTGLLFGIAAPANYFFSYLPYDIKFQPSFNNETIFEGYLNGDIRLRPIKLVPHIIRFIFSSQSIRIIKVFIVEWIRKK